MGVTFENLTLEELCDLMCGDPEPEEDEEWEDVARDLGWELEQPV